MHDFTAYQLGETPEVLHPNSIEANRALTTSLISQATRYVYITSRHLDPLIYDNPLIIEAASRLVRSSTHAHVHILVTQPDPVVKRGHGLIRLAQQLSSKIKVMQPCEEQRTFNQALLIVDGVGYIQRKLADRMEGVGNFNDPFRTRLALETFTELWQRAEPIAGFRRLTI